jgi:hypothetical protein
VVNIQFLVDVAMIGVDGATKTALKPLLTHLNRLHGQKMYLQKVAPMVTIQATPGKNFKELTSA